MSVIAKKTGSNFVPAPAGTHAAVCCDVVDLGVIPCQYGAQVKKQHKIRLCWQLSEADETGKPYIVQKRYTLSLHERAGLRKDLEAWRGRTFTDEELNGWDVEQVIGVPCYLSVVQTKNPQTGETWANINALMRLPKSMPAPTVHNYTRVKDRKENEDGIAQPDESDSFMPDTDSVPF